MKKSIGGDRLGSGSKMQVELHNYDRSTHNLSRDWRSTMSVGTLVPCFCEVGLNGDTFDIDIKELTKTLPTNQPLFGSFKMQVDFFECPIRLYNGLLHNNMQKIGMDMGKVLFPTLEVKMPNVDANTFNTMTNKNQFASDSLLSYLGLKGVGVRRNGTQIMVQSRKFNAVPILAYYDIFKNYYANKQETNAYFISYEQPYGYLFNGFSNFTMGTNQQFKTTVNIDKNDNSIVNITCIVPNDFDPATLIGNQIVSTINLKLYKGISTVRECMIKSIKTYNDGATIKETYVFNKKYGGYCSIDAKDVVLDNNIKWKWGGDNGNIFNIQSELSSDKTTLNLNIAEGVELYRIGGMKRIEIQLQLLGLELVGLTEKGLGYPKLEAFPLSNIDDMRIKILKNTGLGQAVNINEEFDLEPYATLPRMINEIDYFSGQSQVGLCVKTYQSDLYNNWLSSEWIEGANAISGITSIDTSQGKFTMDTLNVAQKVYNMLNRIAVSGGSYEDWQEAVYGEDAIRRAESPIYLGGMSAEIAFEEVVSTATTEGQPLGTLGGKGTTTGHKGGNITVKVKEPCIIMGIVSITPRIDYYQGNKWYMTNLKTMNDLHKPALDGIGFQNLMSEQMAWWSYDSKEDSSKAIGKLPAWINYMTAVNETHGNFAGIDMNEASMVLNRNYESEVDENGQLQIKDATTYIDPRKYNYVWSENILTSQYFWVQLGFNVTARRKMSAKVIPNL